MAEILTQSQIDELLNSMASGGSGSDDSSKASTAKGGKSQPDSEVKWKKYDFGSPKKFTKDRLKMLKSIYDNYARLLSLRLNAILRTVCEAEVFTVEEQRYFEFNNMLSDNDIMSVMHTMADGENKAKGAPMIFHVDQKIMLSMIDRMLGGTGEDEYDDELEEGYTYTEIETVLYEKAIESIVEATEGAWTNYAKVSFTKPRIEENPGLFQEVSLDAPVVIVLVNIRLNNIEGSITICIPGDFLMQIFGVIDKTKFKSSAYEDERDVARSKIMDSLNKSTLNVAAKIAGVTISLEDIYNLQVGDVIDLNMEKDTDVTLYVEEQPWFEGALGLYNKNTAVQINKYLSEENKSTYIGDDDVQDNNDLI